MAVSSMDELEARVVEWATARPDIRTVVVTGSRARTEQPPDEWSDLDVGFFTTDRRPYLATTAWLDEIAEVWLAYARVSAWLSACEAGRHA